MSALTDTLAAQLGQRLRLGTAVEALDYRQGRYVLGLANGASEEFDTVVVAAPAHAQQHMLRDLSPQIAGELGAIPYPALAVVCMGFDSARIGARVRPGLDGFGFLIPAREKRGILGTVCDSNAFPNRAPGGKILLRTMVGGAREPQLAEQADERLRAGVLGDLRDILDIRAEPEFVSIHRHTRAIPQYLVGHARRLDAIGEELRKFPRLVLSGNAFRGVSLNDCVLNAQKTAQALLPAPLSQGSASR
jgi:oxygen-dependent protoporphyrinogen oxidase